ncbi:hypothetical protein E4U41_000041 [Claviceps citrina]|nr:hypothetical protein E4U41_000041 [Claviceps citrina]
MQSPHLERLRLCRRCAQNLSQALQKRRLHHLAALQRPGNGTHDDTVHHAKSVSVRDNSNSERAELGPMSRRLEEATEETLLVGGASGRRAVEEAGFSEELKQKLLDKVAGVKFQQQHKGAFAEAGISSQPPSPSAVQGLAWHMGNESPWTGTEKTVDAVHRMLQDAKKPLKAGNGGKFHPPVVNARMRHGVPQSPGQRAANARDKANMYVGMDLKAMKGLSDEEREQMKTELRERFQPAARAVPATISGIAALANQRIEDAIARGQFKDLPRGKELERDPRADSPFIDTTEYIMNRMIRRQELVPPWIEKQQELTRAARVFRERLRNDWKRHASRMIASRGGTLEEKMRRAAAFAEAEKNYIREDHTDHTRPDPANRTAETATNPISTIAQRPFRDHEWEKAEKAYLDLSIENLNSVTRSYNLMAPELARKPYFSLERELKSCFADVAPLVANEIKTRALGRASTAEVAGMKKREASNLVGKILGQDSVRIHLEAAEKTYGLREWWRDLWKSS